MPPGRPSALVALLAAVALVGCTPSVQACPAIGHVPVLAVQLAPGWPSVEGGTVHVECSAPCTRDGSSDPATGATAPLTGTSATFMVDLTTPDSVAVTVLAADGTRLAELQADPGWTQVGGTEQCGGPVRGTVTVPVP